MSKVYDNLPVRPREISGPETWQISLQPASQEDWRLGSGGCDCCMHSKDQHHISEATKYLGPACPHVRTGGHLVDYRRTLAPNPSISSSSTLPPHVPKSSAKNKFGISWSQALLSSLQLYPALAGDEPGTQGSLSSQFSASGLFESTEHVVGPHGEMRYCKTFIQPWLW